MIRILALGDSYTIGEGVAEPDRWPVRLAAMLRARGFDVANPTIIARTGWTTDELAAGINRDPPSGTYDIVTLLIGVNNQYRGRPLAEYREQFRVMLRRAVDFTGGKPERVFVLSIPDWGVTPFAKGRDRRVISEEIDAFNAANREEADSTGARYVDVTPISRQAGTDASLLAPDGLHPSGSMYQRWAELILPDALAALGN